MFTSLSRLSVLILVLTLCIITGYASIYLGEARFLAIFGLFSSTLGALINHFASKSNKDAENFNNNLEK